MKLKLILSVEYFCYPPVFQWKVEAIAVLDNINLENSSAKE